METVMAAPELKGPSGYLNMGGTYIERQTTNYACLFFVFFSELSGACETVASELADILHDLGAKVDNREFFFRSAMEDGALVFVADE